VFDLDIAYVCNVFQRFFDVFASFSDVCFKCFICLLLYITTVASRCFKSISECCICCILCFKTSSSVASLSLPFYCLTSLLGAGRRRRSPLAQASLTYLRAGATDEMWTGRRRTGGQAGGRSDRGHSVRMSGR
jgi:hypothetical protein